MKTLRDVPLHDVPVLEPSATVAEAVEAMESTPLKTVVLVADGMYMGIFNESTLTSDLIPAGEDRSELQVGPYLHPSRVIGEYEMTVEAARTMMLRKNLNVIPVLDNIQYRGVITLNDLENL